MDEALQSQVITYLTFTGVLLVVAILIQLITFYYLQNQSKMEQSELTALLNAHADQLEKVRTEVQALKDAFETADDVQPELEAAANRVFDAVQAVDDINPDEVVEPPVEPGTGDTGDEQPPV